ncbi:MAG: peptidylprolyl isomerase [Flavobacterium sp.]
MKVRQLLFGFLIAANLTAVAQNKPKEVLFTIDNNPFYSDEFARVYKKNLDLVKDESQKDLNNYLDLYTIYKMKISKANQLGLQNGKQYQDELKSYRSQLAKNYTTDSKVTQELVNEAYKRMQKEVKASHILLLVNDDAAPADTLKVYKRAMEVYNLANKGKDFGDLAVQYSEDPSAKENNGNLGYFSAFRMVYPFESAAFNTPKGSVSKPVRSQFGYHIIKVDDVRDNRGEVSVAHIMTAKPSDGNAELLAKAKNTIDELYKKLQQGEDFETLAKQFSEDKASAPKGGLLNTFSAGQLSSEVFEDVSFGLQNEGDYSKPFETEFGYHIVKLFKKIPMKSFEDIKPEIENRIAKDDRSRLIVKSMNDHLKAKYPFKRNDKLYAALKKAVTDKVYEGDYKLPENLKPFEGTLFTIKDKAVTGVDFLNFIKDEQKRASEVKPVGKLVDTQYEEFVNKQLAKYNDDQLETEYPEFAAIMNEYRDGLLLFDLMEKEIWEKSKTDTIGLQKFYDTHKENYKWLERYDAVVYSSTDKDVIAKAKKFLKKKKTTEYIKEQLNSKEKVNIMSKTGVFEKGNDVLPKTLPAKKGISDVLHEGNYYYVVKVNEVKPAGLKTLDESRGRVINDYQQFLEERWADELRKEFTLKVNQDVFTKVKSELK